MSDFCTCCADNEQFVRDHLNWNVSDIEGVQAVADYTEYDWLREARECKAMLEASGESLEIDDDRLAELLERVYGVV